MEPARTIIEKLGGPSKVAALLSINRVTVAKWKRPKAKGGTGGIIPYGHVNAIVAAAKADGISLTGDDFMPKNTTGEA